jgi:DNA-binding MarR family transcriptional regulator
MVAATPDLSRLLDRMERSGRVMRERAEDDRREVATYITESGMERLATPQERLHRRGCVIA